jgi:hypothetical protein
MGGDHRPQIAGDVGIISRSDHGTWTTEYLIRRCVKGREESCVWGITFSRQLLSTRLRSIKKGDSFSGAYYLSCDSGDRGGPFR